MREVFADHLSVLAWGYDIQVQLHGKQKDCLKVFTDRWCLYTGSIVMKSLYFSRRSLQTGSSSNAEITPGYTLNINFLYS